ncbi:MAG: O-antigen ligase family protein [Candidatus Eremiobacteraeota bacterium]|nr:O-antigen ligase family protein [Candidatus Eremiobacteraeota bacterium]MCW5868363.1 O-antigen ligase family protein [Candidatus Eremiobacteraeota bacterium]
MSPARLSSFLALALLPLIFDMRCADPITAPKLCCWLAAAGLAALNPYRPWTAAEKALALWFGWSVLSALANGFLPAWPSLLTVLAALIWSRSEMPQRNLWLATGFGLTVSYSWLQRLGLDPFTWSDPHLSRLRTIAGLGNPNYLAMYLACLFPWAWDLLYRRGWPGWLIAFFSMIGLLLTATRGSNLVVTAVFVVACLDSLVRLRRLSRFWLVGGLLLALAWGASLWSSGRRQFALASTMVSLGSGHDYSVSARKLLWVSAWRHGLEHPLLGVGPGHFGDAYLLNRDLEPDVLMKRSRRPEDPHNEPLRVLSETGWIGLLLWSAWLMLGLRAQWRQPGPQLAGLLVLLGNSLTNCFTPAVWPLLILWTTPDRRDSEARIRWAGLPILLIGVSAGLAGWLVERTFWWDDEWKFRAQAVPGERGFWAEQRLRALETCSLHCPPWLLEALVLRKCLVWQDIAELTGQPLAWKKAEAFARMRIDLDPDNAYYWRFLAHIYERENLLAQALETWKEAQRRDPLSPAIAFFMAQVQHSRGDTAAALKSLERSLELFSKSRQVYLFRAQIMIEQGRTWEGIEDWVESQVIDEGI